ncbi:hypothetical protein Si004_02082 [Streptococcus infantarius subsp. infantarius]|nr:hypothetical protein [Streptococcus infantarius subsp. infantarius]MCO4682011.1 hypothetical protein [Streptococcus infantarius subsp. infantarius]MCO4684006.1 hypothetical protein [Streptococcus infantarius subsp. infantarius]
MKKASTSLMACRSFFYYNSRVEVKIDGGSESEVRLMYVNSKSNGKEPSYWWM